MKYVKTGPALLAKEHAHAITGKDGAASIVAKDLLSINGAEFHTQQQTQFTHHRLELQEFWSIRFTNLT